MCRIQIDRKPLRSHPIDWGGADVQTLAEIPPVFDGDVLSVFGRVQGSPPKRVTHKA